MLIRERDLCKWRHTLYLFEWISLAHRKGSTYWHAQQLAVSKSLECTMGNNFFITHQLTHSGLTIWCNYAVLTEERMRENDPSWCPLPTLRAHLVTCTGYKYSTRWANLTNTRGDVKLCEIVWFFKNRNADTKQI